jgi:hypothetical protein
VVAEELPKKPDTFLNGTSVIKTAARCNIFVVFREVLGLKLIKIFWTLILFSIKSDIASYFSLVSMLIVQVTFKLALS